MADIKHFDVDAALDAIVSQFWRNGLAATGIQDIVTATGLNRSSLYGAFGNKQSMYVHALRRYIDTWAEPVHRHLTESGRGVPAIIDLFDALIQLRCSGTFAGWGCMITNAHAGIESAEPEIRSLLNRHHEQLRGALGAALHAGLDEGQLSGVTDVDAAAGVLAALVYAINLRSRSGTDAPALRRAVASTFASHGYAVGEIPDQAATA
ncbi:TetR/AcrR family transcriptional regulator [Mycobacterium shigaense]|uniref:TetR family transcriptional regulator n=1 Tax=Mycobacterium shigaense TaxID=722731 RepID=A0A1Z4EMY2_9MYCO|nr:TetR/AcrR family transcriptional regulator [Mycobacterium shigaense]MEA1120652.1 TetR/AcrR family transcriptional regulator [Mycobacterium shigaense]PRI13054.1 TetR family transcriptional regulator [Mycobacterium shigaense]BAX94270.1 TetR family transcriptional regulator [Mycobacterium shigaense]